MYLPFLRGKQFELIALRELADILSQQRAKISPIIEPVKDSFSTLQITLGVLRQNNINFNLIVNPIVGNLTNGGGEIFELVQKTLNEYNNFQVCFYVNDGRSITESLALAQQIRFGFNGFSFIHSSQVNNLGVLAEFDRLKQTNYHIINLSGTSRRYHRNFPRLSCVALEDHFNQLQRNSDYANNDDEFFSEEHLFYDADGFVGFSDYLAIGESFSETGFLPYAVAIHLTYADDQKKIRIHHFVSDSNEDTTDIAGKFSEALDKLIRWVNERNLNTIAIQEFRELHENGHFPGLGMVKKLSIKNHIELVSTLI